MPTDMSTWQGGEISMTQTSAPNGPNGVVSVRLHDDNGCVLFDVYIAPENYAAFALRHTNVDCTYRKREG